MGNNFNRLEFTNPPFSYSWTVCKWRISDKWIFLKSLTPWKFIFSLHELNSYVRSEFYTIVTNTWSSADVVTMPSYVLVLWLCNLMAQSLNPYYPGVYSPYIIDSPYMVSSIVPLFIKFNWLAARLCPDFQVYIPNMLWKYHRVSKKRLQSY